MPRKDLFKRAKDVLAGGVTASMRIHPYLERPVYITHGDGPFVYGEDGKQLIDFNNSNGATILGYRHPEIQEAIASALDDGPVAAAESEHHIALAEQLTKLIPSAERVRFATTGTEVTTLAIRLARHVTGRRRFLKFEGHFHGLADQFLFQRAETFHTSAKPRPTSGGIPNHLSYDIEIVPWNDIEAFDTAMERDGESIAGIICEPVWYNAGCVPPDDGFLRHLRKRADEYNALLIFDEVLSGFRMAAGGAQQHFEVTPDLTTLAKALANGMPLSALVGKTEVMAYLAPYGPVAHSGTYSGHIIAVHSALATLNVLRKKKTYTDLNKTANWFYEQLQESFDSANLPVRVQGLGARFGLYFGRQEDVRTSSDAQDNDHAINAEFVRKCLDQGLYFHAYRTSGAPGHSGITLSHSRDELTKALDIIRKVAKSLGD